MNLNSFLLVLMSIKGIGDASIRKLINDGCIDNIKVEKAEDVFTWLRNHKAYFKNKKLIDKLSFLEVENANNKRVETEKRLQEINAHYISFFDNTYPLRFKAMKKTNDYPILLFYKGNIDLMNSEKVCSIIGTRKPSDETQKIGNRIGYKVVDEGYIVISGLAIGCDTIGHESCLEAGGKTVAILGNGIDIIYPKENMNLSQRILETGGLLITEELPGTPAAKFSLVNRDRLQAAGADVVIALETSIKGGTMHAAKATVEKYHHKLIVIEPKSLPNADASGNVELIEKYGAISINSMDDLSNALNPTKKTNTKNRYFVSKCGFFVDKLIKFVDNEPYLYDNGEWKYSLQYRKILKDTTGYEEVSFDEAKTYMNELNASAH